MATACKVCSHPEVAAINESLGSGTARRVLEVKFGLKQAGLARHARNHLHKTSQPVGPRDYLGELEEKTKEVLRKAKTEKVELDAIKELRAIQADRVRMQQTEQQQGVVANHPAFQAFAVELKACVAGCIRCTSNLDIALERLAKADGASVRDD
jgi:hypothetical protein